MIRDQAGATPQGALSRHPADFFANGLACGGFLRKQNPPAFQLAFNAVGLFNNDPAGNVFKIYGYGLNNDAGGGVGIYAVKGKLSTPQSPPVNVRFDQPAPTGLIFADTTIVASGTLPPTIYDPLVGLLATAGFDGDAKFSPFPMFIVPTGYSIVGLNLEPAGQCGIYFWYEITNS